MIVCLAANPSIDRFFEVKHLEPGSIHRPLGFAAVPGGKGLNAARAVAALGGDACAVALLAGHAGRWIDEALGAEGIERRVTWTDGETRSCLSVADRETGSLTEFYEAGPPAEAGTWERLVALVDELLAVEPGARPAWLTISGSMPEGAPADGYAELIESSRLAGVPCALDSSGSSLASALGAGPDVVKINAAEAAELVEAPCATAGEAMDAARELRRRAGHDPCCAVVTRGTEGVTCVTADGTAWQGRLAAQGPYPVGSGDAFLGGLVVALERGGEWPRALACALGAGAANAEVPGAGRLFGERAASLAGLAEVMPAPDYR